MAAPDFDSLYRENRKLLWGLSYRLTGSTADADEIVQDTFVRAIEQPPADTASSLKPWLVRVATNIGIDRLRRRKETPYTGPWLPSVLDTSDLQPEPADSSPTPEGRYGELESVTLAFLLALEALSPKQRAVLILRDVFDYSVDETSAALDISEADVKTTHHRAREAMAGYDRDRLLPSRNVQQKSQAVLGNLLACLMNRDAAGIEKLLAADVKLLSDGGGQYSAARVPVEGAQKVAKFLLGIAAQRSTDMKIDIRTLNGLPAFVFTLEDTEPGQAPVFVWQVDLDAAGKIREFHALLAGDKVMGVVRGGDE